MTSGSGTSEGRQAIEEGGAKRRFMDVATEGRRSADVRGEEAEERV